MAAGPDPNERSVAFFLAHESPTGRRGYSGRTDVPSTPVGPRAHADVADADPAKQILPSGWLELRKSPRLQIGGFSVWMSIFVWMSVFKMDWHLHWRPE
jgi:hypothetical protein